MTHVGVLFGLGKTHRRSYLVPLGVVDSQGSSRTSVLPCVRMCPSVHEQVHGCYNGTCRDVQLNTLPRQSNICVCACLDTTTPSALQRRLTLPRLRDARQSTCKRAQWPERKLFAEKRSIHEVRHCGTPKVTRERERERERERDKMHIYTSKCKNTCMLHWIHAIKGSPL